MASPPSNPIPPNDPDKKGPNDPSHSDPDTDWLSEVEAMATPGPRKLDSNPDIDDAELDLRALFEDADDSGPPSFAKLLGTPKPPLPGDPDESADVVLEHQPLAPASGWLDVPPSTLIPKFPAAANTPEEDSHIFAMKTRPDHRRVGRAADVAEPDAEQFQHFRRPRPPGRAGSAPRWTARKRTWAGTRRNPTIRGRWTFSARRPMRPVSS